MTKSLPCLTAAALLFVSAACSTSGETSEYQPVDASGWNYGDTLRFDLEPADSIWSGKLAVVIRHTASYPYSNVWLEVSYPAADSISPDTLNMVLADDYGNWLGRGLGLSFQRVDTLPHTVKLTSPASVSLRHIMRTDRLTDIEQAGLIMLPSDN